MQNITKVDFELKSQSVFLERLHQVVGGELLDSETLVFDDSHPVLSCTIKRLQIREGLRILIARNINIKKNLSFERLMDISNSFIVAHIYIADYPLFINVSDTTIQLNKGIIFNCSDISFIDNLPVEQPFSLITFILNRHWIHDYLQPSKEDYLSKLLASNHTFSVIEEMPTSIEQLVKEIINIDIRDAFDKLSLDYKVFDFTIWAFKILEKRESPKAFVNLNRHDLQSILSIQQVLMDNLAAPLPIKVLSKKLGMSESKLKTAFKQVYGTSIYQYIINCRMEKAFKMLESNTCMIGDVSFSLGYVNQSQFTKRFKEHFGMLPTDILKKNMSNTTHVNMPRSNV